MADISSSSQLTNCLTNWSLQGCPTQTYLFLTVSWIILRGKWHVPHCLPHSSTSSRRLFDRGRPLVIYRVRQQNCQNLTSEQLFDFSLNQFSFQQLLFGVSCWALISLTFFNISTNSLNSWLSCGMESNLEWSEKSELYNGSVSLNEGFIWMD